MKLFISYRRADSQYAAGWLDDILAEHYGRGHVFFDTRTIEAGSQFPQSIAEAMADCDVVIPVIGSQWFAKSDDGRRRIDLDEDFVRIELEAALAQGKRIIPVFLQGVSNWSEPLPDSLCGLARLHALILRPGPDLRPDAARLMQAIGTGGPSGVERLLGRWHCIWDQVPGTARPDADMPPAWQTEDAVEVQSILGNKIYARGLNYRQGGFELEGWHSPTSICFLYTGVGDDADVKGTVTLCSTTVADRLEGIWSQFAESDGRVVGGKTVWSKMKI